MDLVDSKISDEELMIRFKNGEKKAFDMLFQRYRPILFRYFLRLCQQPALAEELYQDVWLKLINAKHRPKPLSSPLPPAASSRNGKARLLPI